MKKNLHPFISGNSRPGTQLRHLITQLMSDSLATAIQNKTMIVNEVPSNLHIMASASDVSPVIGELLAAVVSNSKKGIIHIQAERFSDLIILHVKDRNNYNGYALAYSLKSIESLAATFGGSITIKDHQALETTVSFSFPVKPNTPVYDC
jgi:hypothetical protein